MFIAPNHNCSCSQPFSLFPKAADFIQRCLMIQGQGERFNRSIHHFRRFHEMINRARRYMADRQKCAIRRIHKIVEGLLFIHKIIISNSFQKTRESSIRGHNF